MFGASRSQERHPGTEDPAPEKPAFDFFSRRRRQQDQDEFEQFAARKRREKASRLHSIIGLDADSVATLTGKESEADIAKFKQEKAERKKRHDVIQNALNLAVSEALGKSKAFKDVLKHQKERQDHARPYTGLPGVDRARPTKTRSELSTAADLEGFLASSETLGATCDLLCKLCSRVLMKSLPKSVFFGELETRQVLQRQRSKLISSGAAVTQRMGSQLGIEDLDSENYSEAERLHQRKMLRSALEDQGTRETAVPSNHPLQSIADDKKLWLSFTQPSMVHPPLHCSGRQYVRNSRATTFDNPDARTALPIGVAPEDSLSDSEPTNPESLGERVEKRNRQQDEDILVRISDVYTAFIMSLEGHPLRPIIIAMVPEITMSVCGAVMESQRLDPSGSDLAVDITEHIVTNADEAERIRQTMLQRNKKAYDDVMNEMNEELHYLLTGMDKRKSTRPKLPGPPAFPWQDPKFDKEHDGKANEKEKRSGSTSPPQAESRGLKWLQMTNEKFRKKQEETAARKKRTAHLFQETAASRARRLLQEGKVKEETSAPTSANTTSAHGQPTTGASSSPQSPQPESPKSTAPTEDLSLNALNEGLMSIKRAQAATTEANTDVRQTQVAKKQSLAQRARNVIHAMKLPLSSQPKSQDTSHLSVTEKVVGKEQAKVVQRFKVASMRTMHRKNIVPWNLVGKAHHHYGERKTLQVCRFNMEQVSPLIRLKTKSNSKSGGGRPLTAPKAQLCEWTI